MARAARRGSSWGRLSPAGSNSLDLPSRTLHTAELPNPRIHARSSPRADWKGSSRRKDIYLQRIFSPAPDLIQNLPARPVSLPIRRTASSSMSLDARDDVTRGVRRASRAQASVLAVGLPNSRDPPITRGTSLRVRPQRAVLAVLFSAASGANAASVACGYYHTCAIRDDGRVWCWGSNDNGRLGMGSAGGSSAAPVGPLDLGSGRTAKAICAGSYYSCAILDDGTVKCWGSNGNGQLGYGDTTNRDAPPATPVDLGTGRTAKAVSCGSESTCAILDDDSLKCWGANGYGQLGIGDPQYSSSGYKATTPTAVVATNLGAGVKSVATGSDHTCAVLNDGSLKCWGMGMYVSLGYSGLSNPNPNTPPAENVNRG